MKDRPLSCLLSLTALAVLLVCAGCAAGETAQRLTVAGGGQVMLTFDKGNIRPTREGDLESHAGFEFSKEAKTFTYVFELVERKNQTPRRIRVHDVTDNDAVPLVDETAPAWNTVTRSWLKRVGPLGASDPRIAWLRTLGNSTRVYRFTVETADGRTVEMMQGWFYPSIIKSGLRQVVLSENY